MVKNNKEFQRLRKPTEASFSKQNKHPKKRKQQTEQEMLDAIESATAGGMSGNKAAVKHGIPPSTFKDRLSGRVKHGTKPGPIFKPSRRERTHRLSFPSSTIWLW